ncbi:MAG: tRNA pseudouridine(38-40) synthase TruA [Opitutales bacterium]|nr:tRNA pseudouridine(38-40) synthase TruA [Opitutales bacterium]
MRWKCVCQYDGTEFCGWQSQPNRNTIQDYIEKRLSEIFGSRIKIYGSGRTDAGVHARGQVFHFDADWEHESWQLLRALRCGIPPTIRIISAEHVSKEFNARFSVKQKCYKYYLLEDFADAFGYRYNWCLGNRRLDVKSMQSVAVKFCGTHDFSAFGANREDGEQHDPVKTMHVMQFSRIGNMVTFVTIGSGYLYKMVRMMVGGFVMVGLNKLTADELYGMLISGKRTQNIEVAPAHGLFLEFVEY